MDAVEIERLRFEQLETSRKLGDLAEKVAAQRDELTHRINKIEIRLMLYALGGSAAGAIIGSAGSAAARTLIGG